MKRKIVLTQTQMDKIVNASEGNSLDPMTLYKFNVQNMYELLFIQPENGYWVCVKGNGNTLETELDEETFDCYMDVINNPVL